MDADLESLPREKLIAEIRKLRNGIREHRDSTGHDLCWHHPALWGLLPEKSDPLPTVPEWPQFLAGCIRYRQSLDTQLPQAPRSSRPFGWHSITPRLVAQETARLIVFLREAFDAQGEVRADRPAQLTIGDSIVMVSGTEARKAMPAFLYLYVDDADSVYESALKAGGVSLEKLWDTPYGDRRGMVEDPCGNVWQIATHRPQPEV